MTWLEWLDIPLDMRLVAVAAAVFAGGFLRGFVGFGAALIAMPILSNVFGPKLAVAMSTVMGVPVLFQMLPDAIRYSERHIVLPICSSLFVAAPLGSSILITADPGLMKIAIAGLVVLMVAFLASGWKMPAGSRLSSLLMAGVASGLIQGSSGMGGPPVVAVALSRPGEPRMQRANVLALTTAVALSSLPPLLYYGLITRRALFLGLLMVPIYSAATALGNRYFSLGGARYFRTAALIVLGVVGVVSLGFAVRDYWIGQ